MLTPTGNKAFCAPELVDEITEGYNLKVDMWSAGVVMFSLLMGKLPFIDPEYFK